MSENTRFGEIRSLLHGEGTASTWAALCALVDLCDQNELTDRIIPYIKAHLDRWPVELRIAPRRWSERLEHDLPIERLSLASELVLYASRSTLRAVNNDENHAQHPQLEGLLARGAHLRPKRLGIHGRLSEQHIKALGSARELLAGLEMLHIEKSQLGDGVIDWLVGQAATTNLEELHLPHNRLGRAGLGLLCESSGLPKLHTLRLDHNNPGPLIAEELLRAPWAGQLEHFGIGGAPLDARGGELGWESVVLLAEARFFHKMRSIALSGNQLGHASGGPGVLFPRAEELDLSFNHLSDDGLARILDGCDTEKLIKLHLSINRLTSVAVDAITREEGPHLKQLDLFGNAITSEGLRRLLESPTMRDLEVLNLGSTQGEAGFLTEVREWSTSSLEELSFQGTAFDDNDAYILSRAEPLARMRVLDLSSTQIHARGVRALATSPSMNALERIILNYSRVGDEGIIALAAREQPSLRRLDLRACGISVQGARALASAPWLGQLESLDLSNNPLSEEGRRLLYEAEELPLHLRIKYKPLEP